MAAFFRHDDSAARGRVRPAASDGRPPTGPAPALDTAVEHQLVLQDEVVMAGAGRGPETESFRQLRAVLSEAHNAPTQVVIVTSALPGEGKSFIALNLALAHSLRSDGATLLVDADLRRPTQARWMHPAPEVGVTDVLQGRLPVEEALITLTNSPLTVLPQGRLLADPMLLLDSIEGRTLVARLRQRFAHVIVDTPPVVPFADARVLASMADGLLLVARADFTPQPLLLEALETLSSVRVLGIVLNDVRRNLADRRSSYYSYYTHYYKQDHDQ